MTQVSATLPGDIVRRRSIRRWLIRSAASLLAFAVVAYVALPVWLPTAWLAQRLGRQLSDRLQCDVRVGNLSVSWVDGVEVKDITIAETQGNHLLARVGRIRTGFTPWYTLRTGRIDVLEVDNPQIWIDADAAGQFELPELSRGGGDPLPTRKYIIRNATCHVRTAQIEQQFVIDQLTCRLNETDGTLSLFAGTGVLRKDDGPGRGRLEIDAELTVPQLNRDLNLELTGEGHVTWSDLALSDLPVPIATRLPVEQVAGNSDGHATFKVNPDLGINFDFGIQLAGVQLRDHPTDKPTNVPDASLAATGHFDPGADRLTVETADYRSNAMHVYKPSSRRGPMLVLDPRGETPLDANVAGVINDIDALMNELPIVERLLRHHHVSLGGRLSFAMALERNLREDRFHLDLDGAAGARWQWSDEDGRPRFVLPGQDRKTLQADMVFDHVASRITDARVVFFCGDTTVDASAAIVLPEQVERNNWATYLKHWRSDRIEVSVSMQDLSRLAVMLPRLVERLNIEACRGPGRVEFSLEPRERQSVLVADLSTGEGGLLRIGRWLNATKPLNARVDCLIPHARPQAESRVFCHLSHGAARIDLLHPVVESAPSIDEDFDAQGLTQLATQGDWRIRDVAGLLELFPVATKALETQGIDQVGGDADVNARIDIVRRAPDEKISCRLMVDADALAFNSPQMLKQPGWPMRSRLDCVIVRDGPLRRLTHDGELQHPAGRFRWRMVTTGDRTDPLPLHLAHAEVEADLQNTQYWLRTLPGLHRALASREPAGRLRAEATVDVDGDVQRITANLDATEGAFLLPEAFPIHRKPLGVPARCDVHLAATRHGEATDLEITQANAALAGVRIDRLDGRLVTADRTGDNETLPDLIDSIAFDIAGSIDVDRVVPYLEGAYAEQLGAFSPGGRADWQLSLAAKDAETRIEGRIGADRLTFSRPLDSTLVPRVTKDAAVPMSLDFNVTVERSGGKAPGRCRVDQLALRVGDNRLVTSGELQLDPRKPAMDLHTVLALEAPATLAAMIPGGMVEDLGGGMHADVALAGSLHQPSLEAAELRFDNWQVQLHGERFAMNGAMSLRPDVWDTSRVEWSWGPTSGIVSGRLERTDDRYLGHVGLKVGQVDVADMQRRFAMLRAEVDQSPTTAPAAETDTAANEATRQELLALLGRCGLHVDIQADSCRLTLPPAISVLADAVNAQGRLEKGAAKLTFSSVVDGGAVRGELVTRLDVDDPVYHLTYRADRLQPGPVSDAYLATSFPGLLATGPLTLSDESYQELFPEPGEWETGKGELIVEGGTVEGRAAPLWMTRIFPKLNLARFEFSYMHSWFTKQANGRIYHNMIFLGRNYNVYMNGYSDRDATFRYEVGIDFLADYDSQYWGETGQGRVPLFVKTGRLGADGQILDETVTYQPPHRILDVLLVKNNPFVTAYYAVRRRALSDK